MGQCGERWKIMTLTVGLKISLPKSTNFSKTKLFAKHVKKRVLEKFTVGLLSFK